MKQLGKLLIEEEMLTQDQLDQALSLQQSGGGKLGTCLVKLGILTEEALFYFLAVQLGTEFIELQSAEIKPEIIHMVSKEVALRYQVVPWAKSDNVVTFVSSDPTDPKLFKLREDLLLNSRTEISYLVSTESGIRDILTKYYGSSGNGSGPSAAAAQAQGSEPVRDE